MSVLVLISVQGLEKKKSNWSEKILINKERFETIKVLKRDVLIREKGLN